MGKTHIFILLAILLIGFVSAESQLSVEEIDRGSTIIKEIGGTAHYDLVINNPDEREYVQIYSLVSVVITPKENIEIPKGEKQISIEATPTEDLVERTNGQYTYQYQIKGIQGIYIDKLTMRIVSISDVLDIKGKDLKPQENDGKILVTNKENVKIEGVNIELKSPFFEVKREGLTFGPKETVEIPFIINKEEASKLKAGNYLISGEVEVNGQTKKVSGEIDYLEEEGLSVSEDNSGLIMRKNVITKINKGNTVVDATIEKKKDIVTRLVTVYSVAPTSSERNGMFVNYVWEKELSPGESFEVVTNTNYTLPFLLVLLIAIVVYLANRYYRTDVVLSKRVSYVKTSQGQFAVKVSLHVKSRKTINDLKIIDRVPNSTKIYDKFGIRPTKIDHATRRLIWEVSHLKAGEERWYSYIVYSNLKIFGRFEFPNATAVYKVDGNAKEVFSNKTSFINESK